MPETPPAHLVALAERRVAARRARDWGAADALKAAIEAEGWRIVDAGLPWHLERAIAPDVVDGGRVHHGSAASVPSVAEEAATARLTAVVVAEGGAGGAAATVAALVEHAGDGLQVVVVANGVPAGADQALEALDATDPGAPGVAIEVVRTAVVLSPGAARNAGLRRARGELVAICSPGSAPGTDVVAALEAALADPEVAVAGPGGLASADLAHWEAAAPGERPVAAIGAPVVAFRRADWVALGPFDEAFRTAAVLDAWWSLVLRDGGASADLDEDALAALSPDELTAFVAGRGAAPVRTARQVALPMGEAPGGPAPDGRLVRRDRYRLLKRFAARRDLALA